MLTFQDMTTEERVDHKPKNEAEANGAEALDVEVVQVYLVLMHH